MLRKSASSETGSWIRAYESRPEIVGPCEMLVLSKVGPIPVMGMYSATLGKFMNERGMVCDKEVIAWRKAKRDPGGYETGGNRSRPFSANTRISEPRQSSFRR